MQCCFLECSVISCKDMLQKENKIKLNLQKGFLIFVVPGNRVETSCFKRGCLEEQIFGLILPKVTRSVLRQKAIVFDYLAIWAYRLPRACTLLLCCCIPWFEFVNPVDLRSLRRRTPDTLTTPFLREPGHNLSITAAVSHPSVTVRNELGSLIVYYRSTIFCTPALFSITFVDFFFHSG